MGMLENATPDNPLSRIERARNRGKESSDEGSGGGGGGGVAVSPVGYIEVRDNSAEFKRILTRTDVVALAATASIAAHVHRRLLD